MGMLYTRECIICSKSGSITCLFPSYIMGILSGFLLVVLSILVTIIIYTYKVLSEIFR